MSNSRYRRLFRLRFTKTSDADVDQEFAFHLAMRASELEARGMSADEARAETLRQFGDIDDARRACRAEDTRRMRDYRWALWIDNARQDIRLAFRAMRRQPAFSVSTVVTLGVAIAIATSAYGVLHAYVIRPLPYPDADRLVQVIAAPSRDPFPNAPSLASVDWRTLDTVFAETVAWDLDGFTLAGGERPEFVDGAWVSPGYFRALGMRPGVGRGFLPSEFATLTPVAIISDGLWNRRYNRDPSVVGRTIRAHSTDRPRDDELVTIVGVMPSDAWHVSRFTDVLRPLSVPRFASIAKLKPGMSIAEAEQRLNAVVRPQIGSADPAWHMSLVSVQDEYTHRIRPTLVAFLGAALLLLLIGGASVAGAQTARAAARRAELRVRAALGASRGRLMMLLLTETVVVAACAGVLGAALAALTLATVGATIGEQLGAGVPGGAGALTPGLAGLGLATGTGVLVGVVFGLLPALSATLSRESGGTSFGERRGSATAIASPLLRRSLIVAQVACTMMLLVGAGLMARTTFAIGTAHLGFEPDSVVKGNLLLPLGTYPDAAARRAGVARMLERLSATPGVRSAAIATPHPYRAPGPPLQVVTPEGSPATGGVGPRATQYVVSDGYFDTMRIPLRRGRTFGEADARSAAVVVVSEALASELWPDQEAIGRRLRIDRDTVWRSVIGVVAETRESVEAEQEPDMYLPFTQVTRAFVSVLVRVDGDPVAAATQLPGIVGSVNEVLALSGAEPLSDVVWRDSHRQRALAVVFTVLGFLALGIAMLGLYAALSYVVAQRRREIAVRVAVGAGVGHIVRLVAAEGAVVVLLGIAMGALLSTGLTRVLRTLLYGIGASDPATFGSIAILLGIAALAAALSPARDAARVQPAEAMRSE